MSGIKINTVFNIDLVFEIAPFPRRLLAYLIDFSIMIAYMFSMKYLLYKAMGLSFKENVGLDILIVSFPMLMYSLISEVLLNGQTLGKKLMSLRVISLDGGEPTLGQYILRWITKFFEWPFLFGYVLLDAEMLAAYIFLTGFLGISVVIIIAVAQKSQRLGDFAANTVVVNAKTNLNVSDTIFVDVGSANYKVAFPQVMRLSDNDINTINTVLSKSRKRNDIELSNRIAAKIKDVLQIQSNLYSIDFLEKLLEDYNYLATKTD